MHANSDSPIARRSLAFTLAVALTVAIAACASRRDTLTAPDSHIAPYDASRGAPVWAVVPLRNESGTSLVDELEVSDRVIAAIAQVEGLRVLPLNRSLGAMAELNMAEPQSPAQLRRLAEHLNVDGVVVGSITAWNPYDPPTIGIALALYVPPGRLHVRTQPVIDTQKLVFQPTDYQYFASPTAMTDAPASVVSEHLDARNHAVLMRLQRFAAGRSDPHSAYGWRVYVVSMERYADFAAWAAVGRLIDHEWLRLSNPRLAEAVP